MTEPEKHYLELRNQILAYSPEQYQIVSPPGAVWATVADFGLAEGSITLVGVIDGGTSLYFSYGGGFLGGQAHESIRSRAIELNTLVGKALQFFVKTEDFPLPKTDEVFFYARIGTDVYTATMLRQGSDDPSEMRLLFRMAMEIIAEFRLLDEKKKVEDANNTSTS